MAESCVGFSLPAKEDPEYHDRLPAAITGWVLNTHRGGAAPAGQPSRTPRQGPIPTDESHPIPTNRTRKYQDGAVAQIKALRTGIAAQDSAPMVRA